MKKRTDGFTLIELLVVITIIGVLAALLLPVVFGAMGKQQVIETQALIKNLGDSLLVYHKKTGEFPLDYEGEGPMSAGVKGVDFSDKGYFFWLQNFHTVTYKSGKEVPHYQPYFSTNDDFRFEAGSPYKATGIGDAPYDDHFIKDLWGNPVQYRLMPQSLIDFQNRFMGPAATKKDYLKFISKQKPFHIWSYGPENEGDQEGLQKYIQTDVPQPPLASGSNGDYESGGFTIADNENDDIGNW